MSQSSDLAAEFFSHKDYTIPTRYFSNKIHLIPFRLKVATNKLLAVVTGKTGVIQNLKSKV